MKITYDSVLGEVFKIKFNNIWASLVAQLVKNLPAMWEIWARSLGWEDPLENGKATHSSILAYRVPYSPWGRKELNTTEQLSLNNICDRVCKLLSRVWLFATPWTIYSPWNSPGQDTGVGNLSLLQGILQTQQSNPGLPPLWTDSLGSTYLVKLLANILWQ